MNKTVIDCKQVSKYFFTKRIINNISFQIARGENVMLLGANGSGKTTLLKLILGIAQPSSGWIKLQEVNPIISKARENIGVMIQNPEFSKELTTLEIMQFIKSHYKQSFSIDELSDIFMLSTFKNKLASKLSVGQKRRLALALAFLNKPKIVILDEPTAGLDVQSRHHILSFIKNYTMQTNVTLLLTTHYLEEADMLTDRIIYLESGLIKSDTVKNIFKSEMLETQIQFDYDSDFDHNILAGIKNQFNQQGKKVIIFSNNTDNIVRCLVKHNVPFYNLSIIPPTLERFYANK